MTSKIVVNNIEADSGINTITFINEVTAPTFNGNITGTAATFSGNVDIAGALTYEDVTNVDSVGIITARSGIHVSGGNVGIGTDESYGDGNSSFSSLSLGGNGTKFGLLEINKSDGIAGSWIDCYGTGGNGDLRITTAGTSGKITFWTGGEFTEKVTIASNGSVGIGTTNPSVKLEVATSVDGEATLATFKNTSGGGTNETVDIKLGLENTVASNVILRAGKEGNHSSGAAADNFFAVHTTEDNTSSEKLRITSGGNIGIGTDNPQALLDVEGIGQFGNNPLTDTGIQLNGDVGRIRIGRNGNVFEARNGSDSEIRAAISGGSGAAHFLGSVGIGTDTPNHKLTLFQSGTGTFDAVNFVTGNTNSTGYQMGVNSTGEVFHWNTTNSSINFATNNAEKFRITTNVGPWAEGNKGVDRGTIHLRPESTDHMGGAITFGASDSGSGNSAMAGIYTRSDGTYGTKMYLATTDSYATGPKNFLEADEHGRIRTPRQPYVYGSPTNTNGSGIFNDLKNASSRGGLAFTSDRITVAREGVYLICFNTICDSSSSRQDATIRVNGNTIVNTLSEDSTAGYHYRGASICYYLNENDYIQVANDDWYDATSSTNWKSLSVVLLG